MTANYHAIESAIDDFAQSVRRAEHYLTGAQARPGEFEQALKLVALTRKRLNNLIIEALKQKARL